MKYRLLTKEQFEELHEEFSRFLATQKIDAEKWQHIIKKEPDLAREELELFSDMIWDKVLEHTQYLEHISEKDINLFKCDTDQIERIVIHSEKDDFNFLNKNDFKWFVENTNHKSMKFLKGKKAYVSDRKKELFDLILKGAVISKGELFEAVKKIL